MSRYLRQVGPRKHAYRRILLVLTILIGLVGVGTVLVHRNYSHNLQPVSSSTKEVHVTIYPGASSSEIGEQLMEANLIRNAQTFEWYVNTHNIRDKLQAGTYSFSESMSTDEIAEAIAAGEVATDLITILPGQRIDQIKETFIDAGMSKSQIATAFSASRYRSSYPALADNPKGSSLEGFLFPDSYQLTADTDPSEIVSQALDQMQEHLTSDIRAGFAKQGLTVYEGVTLASIVEQEVPKADDRAKVAQVFLSRLKKGMPLGSDVTVIYAKKIQKQAYDTTDHKGLPPGPIGTISDSALKAVARPANTTWLYFLSGDDGKTYYARTYEQHKANILNHCRQNCAAAKYL